MTNTKKYFFFLIIAVTVVLAAVIIILNSGTLLKIVRPGTQGYCKNCNVILVSLDTLSANHLPCYGYSRDTSPNLCKFASQNIFFKKAYSNATWTLPGTASIFTGLYPYMHGIINAGDSLSDADPFLLKILKDNSYYNIFVSNKKDYTIPLNDVYNRGIDKFIDEGEENSWQKGLNEFKKNVASGNKTFLFLHTYDVHDPYIIGDNPKLYTNLNIPAIPTKISDLDDSSVKYFNFIQDTLNKSINDKETDPAAVNRYKKIIEIIKKYKDNPDTLKTQLDPYIADTSYLWDVFNFQNKVSTNIVEHVEYIKALYDQTIHQMDTGRIADFLNFINDPVINKNTIVIITADHGEEFMEHGHITHITTYDSNLKIPLIIKIPGINRPIGLDAEVESADILPTILDSVGITIPSKVNGISLMPQINGKPAPKRLLISDGENLDNRVIRKDGWTLFIKELNGNLVPYEFYNTNTDPDQKNNVLVSNINKANDLLNEYLSSYKLKNGD